LKINHFITFKYNSYFKIDANQFLSKRIAVEADKYDLSMYNADDLRKLIEACISIGNEQIACHLINNLKTSITNDFVRTEEFFESKAYEMVMKELKLK
jgi:hypothetical protein